MRSLAGIAIRDGKVFVAQRKPGGDLGGKWEFPGGKAEAGESDGQTLLREWDEEFGLDVTALSPIGESWFTHSGKRYELSAWTIAFDGEPAELREHDSFLWVDRAGLEALDLAESDRTLLPYVLALLG